MNIFIFRKEPNRRGVAVVLAMSESEAVAMMDELGKTKEEGWIVNGISKALDFGVQLVQEW